MITYILIFVAHVVLSVVFSNLIGGFWKMFIFGPIGFFYQLAKRVAENGNHTEKKEDHSSYNAPSWKSIVLRVLGIFFLMAAIPCAVAILSVL